MRRRLEFLALVCLFAACLRVRPGIEVRGIVLVQNGRSDYQIVLSKDTSASDQRAGQELQKYLEAMSRVRVPLVVDDAPPQLQEILIGPSRRLNDIHLNVPWEKLEQDGFLLKTQGQKLIIAGGSEKGALYGVYTLLEDYLGCRKYSASAGKIPHRPTIKIGPLERMDIPWFRYREVYMPDVFDDDFADWHKLDNRTVAKRQWGLWVHTFDDFVPASRYFGDHPEYFSEIHGVRTPDGQLCLTNPNVFRIIVERLRARLKENPEARYWSVSQNDTFYSCQCPDCLARDKKYGAPSGTILEFVNRVAREFPDKVISTLAYQYSRAAPIGIRPEKNVNIVLCTIECNRSRPLAADPATASFVTDIKDWGKLTDNILLWDYVVQFRNYCDPFPNLGVLQPNLQFFSDNNVRMMFEQGSGRSRSEFQELRTYLLAKLLWNPKANVGALIDDFTDGYYGRAAPSLRRYIQLLHSSLDKSGGDLQIYGYPFDGFRTYLTPALLGQYAGLFNKAEAAAGGETEILKRVKCARLPLEFAILEISKRNVTPRLSTFIRKKGGFGLNPEMPGRLDAFAEWANRVGFLALNENGTPPDAYKSATEEFFSAGAINHIALDRPAHLLTPASEKYPVGGARALTDGLKGTRDYHSNWLGFEGTEMEATIDLGTATRIQSISAAFLQDANSWIWIPEQVEFSISKTGAVFEKTGSLEGTTDPHASGEIVENFSCTFSPQEARYIKIKTRSVLQCPAWHKGAGGKAWIFTDEIVVQ